MNSFRQRIGNTLKKFNGTTHVRLKLKSPSPFDLDAYLDLIGSLECGGRNEVLPCLFAMCTAVLMNGVVVSGMQREKLCEILSKSFLQHYVVLETFFNCDATTRVDCYKIMLNMIFHKLSPDKNVRPILARIFNFIDEVRFFDKDEFLKLWRSNDMIKITELLKRMMDATMEPKARYYKIKK